MRIPLNLEQGSRTTARARAPHRRRIRASSLRPTSWRDRAYACLWVLGHFHETVDENSSRLLCPLERVRIVTVHVLFLSFSHRSCRRSRPLEGGWYRGWRSVGVVGLRSCPRTRWRKTVTIEPRSIHAGNHAGCCASRVEIERRALKNDRGAAVVAP